MICLHNLFSQAYYLSFRHVLYRSLASRASPLDLLPLLASSINPLLTSSLLPFCMWGQVCEGMELFQDVMRGHAPKLYVAEDMSWFYDQLDRLDRVHLRSLARDRMSQVPDVHLG